MIGDDSTTLQFISDIPGAPSLPTLKKRSNNESWPEQRKQYRYQRDTKVYQDDTGKSAIAKIERIIDTAEVITRHTAVSKWLMDQGKKALENAETISPSVAVQMIKLGLEGERICMGLDSDRASQELNPDELSDEELQKIANG